jgi:polysaccharide chain length determinant protein (PEP-CTERM system associated)
MNGLYDEIKVALHNVWKRRWVALGVAWAICLIGWLIVSMIPNKYESEARVFVQMQSLLPDKIGVTAGERQRDVERVKRTLTSTVNLEKVVRGTDLALQVSSNRDVTEKAAGLREKIKVIEQQENLFQITASSNQGGLSNAENAKLSRAIVQKLIDIFVEENLNGGRTDISQTLRFLDQQIVQREGQLREAETKRVAFETKYMGLLPGAGSSSQRMEAGRIELNQIESNLIGAQSSLAALNGQLASTPPSITGPGSYANGGGSRARVVQLEGMISEAQSRGWTDSHPDMAGLRSQLARARAAAATEGSGYSAGSSSPNPSYAPLRSMQAEKQAMVAALTARKGQLQAEMAQYAAKQGDEPGVVAEQQRLSRDYDVIKTQYDKLVADRADVRLQGDMNTSTDAVKFRVIDPPSNPRAPSTPDRPLLLTGVLILGILAGIGAAFAMSQLQTGFVTAQRLASASGLTVIGSVSEVLTTAQREMNKRRMRFFAGGGAALAGIYGVLLVVEMIQRSSVA